MSRRIRSKSVAETKVEQMSALVEKCLRTPRKRQDSLSEYVFCSPPKRKRDSVRVERNPITPLQKTPRKSLSAAFVDPIVRTPLSPFKGTQNTPTKQNEESVVQKTLQCLCESGMIRPISRKKEIETISSFLREKLENRKPGSLYLTGPPGTGKTACVMHCFNEYKSSNNNFKAVIVNCMSAATAVGIVRKIRDQLGIESAKSKNIYTTVKQHICSKGPMILLVLDEMDLLETRHQEVLYNIFEWTTLANSRLVLIGLANALQPLENALPCLRVVKEHKTQIISFHPYTKEQIKDIIEDRLLQCKEDNGSLVTPVVIEYCSRNAASNNGDVRKALAMLSQAVLMASKAKTSPLKHSPTETSTVKSPTKTKPVKKSPLKTPVKPAGMQVKLHHLQKVVNTVSNSLSWADHERVQLPLQQKIVVFCLVSILKGGKSKETTVGKLHDSYLKLCRKQGMTTVDNSELFSLCILLEDCGIMGVKKHKEARLAKVCLRVSEIDLMPILRQEKLLASLLDQEV